MGNRFFILSILWAIVSPSLSFSEPLSAEVLMQEYSDLHTKTLKRLLSLEDRIDGLTSEFRKLLGDRKQNYESSFKGPGKLLPDPVLISAIISERKRIERDQDFVNELQKRKGLSKQYLKKIGSNLLALELSSILISYVEYLDEYNRGVRPIPGKTTVGDLDLLKVLAASLTAIEYSKEKKAKLYFSDKRLLALDPQGAQNALAILENGLGKINEESIVEVKDVPNKKEQLKLEMERLQRTQNLISVLKQLAMQISQANKSLLDEYQYHVIKLNQKMRNDRILTSPSKK